MKKLTVIQVSNGCNPYSGAIGGIISYVNDIVGVTDGNDQIDNTEINHSFIGSGLPMFDGYYCMSRKSYPNYVFLLLLFLNIFRFPNDSNVVYHIHTNYLGLPFYLFKRKSKMILTIHGITDVSRKKRKALLLYFLYKALNTITVRGYAGFVADTVQAMDHFEKTYKTNGKKRIVIPVGVNTNLFYPLNKAELRNAHGIPLHRKIILFVGRFAWEKNIELLIESYAIFQKNHSGESQLLLVGDGYLMKQIKNLVSTSRLENVVFLGSLSRHEVRAYMNISDAFVITSIIEGGPITLKEALACNLPVVSVPVGDVCDVLPNFSGSIITDYDPVHIAQALEKVTSSDTNIDYQQNIRAYSMTDFQVKMHDFYRVISNAR